MRRGFPFGIWLGQQHGLAVVMSVFTVRFELFFFVSLLLPRAAPLFFFISAIFFHLGLYAAAGHDFFQHIALNFTLLVCLTPWWWWEPLTRYLERFRSGRQAQARQPW